MFYNDVSLLSDKSFNYEISIACENFRGNNRRVISRKLQITLNIMCTINYKTANCNEFYGWYTQFI